MPPQGHPDDSPPFGPHLGRLRWVWARDPLSFITTCTAGRRPVLIEPVVVASLRAEWLAAESRHGWRVGRYVIMPDHVHFFAAPVGDAKALSEFVGRWKEWTAKAALRILGGESPFWQHRFFDHVLRSRASFAEKWEYVRQNPVRANLVRTPDGWPHAGHIHFDDPV
jgi:REP element-mobilizing transposase RayT